MKCTVFTRRLSLLSIAATAGVFAAMVGSSAQATLVWYDGFGVGEDDGAGPNYVAGNIAGQLGGSDAGSGIGFFDNGAGDPNPWLGVSNTDPADTDSTVTAGSISRPAQNKPSTGDKVDASPDLFGCCYTSRTSRDFNAPLQAMNGQVYMGFLVNFGEGNPGDPHYRAIEFWNGKNSSPPPNPGDPPGTSDGRVGDGVLTMALGISSFGNFNDPVNGPAGNNRQISLKTKGVREAFGNVVEQNVQLDEHMEWAANQQLGQTHSIVIGFDLTTDDVELGGVGDTISVWLDPTLDDVTPPAPSAVVSGIDVNIDSMSNIIAFTFTGIATPGAFDELRVATSFGGALAGGAGDANTLWGEVAILSAPEPASLSLVGLGALGMLLTSRRKRS